MFRRLSLYYRIILSLSALCLVSLIAGSLYFWLLDREPTRLNRAVRLVELASKHSSDTLKELATGLFAGQRVTLLPAEDCPVTADLEHLKDRASREGKRS